MTGQSRDSGLLFVLVGPGGAGKNALMRAVMPRIDNMRQLATATTRKKRDHETDGREHLFLSLEQFQAMINNHALLEYQEVTPGKFYGIPRQSVEDQLNAGLDLIADIEVLGARILRETYPTETILVFITVPGDTEEEILNTLQDRMRTPDRNEDEKLIQQRLERARELELPFASQCDYVIVNDELERASGELYEIIMQRRVQQNQRIEESA